MTNGNTTPDLSRADLVISGASQLLTVPAGIPHDAPAEERLGLVEDGGLVISGGKVSWTGPAASLPDGPPDGFSGSWIDAGGRAVIPGLVDCHTHLVHGGSREREFEWRIQGRSYADIAREGGGILSTVAATRAASAAELVESGMHRLDECLRQGVTTVEVKSGYGLETATEIKMLEVAAEIGRRHPVDVMATFLGAHEVPAEYRTEGGKERYLDLVIGEMIPEVGRRKLASFCDVFCETGVYTRDEAERVLRAGLEHGLRPRVHADQLTDTGGAALAAELGAVSADHLEFTNDAGMEAMARAGVAAVLLPGCVFFLGAGPWPDARRMMDKGLAVALATDFNPGSCMTQSLPLVMTMACTMMRMTPAESLLGATRYAAGALGLEGICGSLCAGSAGDAVILDGPDYRTLCYHFGTTHASTVIKAGRVVLENGQLV
jgi:imidazolonepropionase